MKFTLSSIHIKTMNKNGNVSISIIRGVLNETVQQKEALNDYPNPKSALHLLVPRHQIIHRSLRIIGKPFRQHRQQVVQVSLGVESIGLGGLQDGEDNHAGIGSGLSVTEEPVLSADDNRADGVLHLVVDDLDLTVVEERAKIHEFDGT